jgi:uncharacterized protein DUF6880
LSEENNEKLITTLSRLDSQILAETLVALSETSEHVEEAVQRLVATPQQRLERFSQKLEDLNNPQGFVRGQTTVYAQKMQQALDELRTPEIEAQKALECLSRFFQSDQKLIESYDDTSGTIGELFRDPAARMFAGFAAEQPEQAVEHLLVLLSRDPYNTRIPLLRRVANSLPAESLTSLAESFEKQHADSDSDSAERHYNNILLALAKPMKDAALYLRIVDRHRTELNLKDYLEVARIHLAHERYEEALNFVQQAPRQESQTGRELAKVGLRCLRELGRFDELEEQAWQLFSVMPTRVTFQELVEQVGEEKRAELTEKAVAFVQETEEFSNARALLLLHLGSTELAEEYVLQRAKQVRGEDYFVLSELADELAQAGRNKGATFCYRSLLDSILKRANSRAYRQAALYFHNLNDLAQNLEDWGDLPDHQTYLAGLRGRHGRKGSFWSRVDELRPSE